MPQSTVGSPGLGALSPLAWRADVLEARIATPRLSLSSTEDNEEHVDLYRRLYGCPEVMEKSGDGRTRPHGEIVRLLADDAERWRRGDPFGALTVARRDGGAPIGVVRFRRRPEPGTGELGYLFDRQVWGQGYGREAVEAAVAQLPPAMSAGPWRLGGEPLHTLWCGTRADNPASLKILGHLGFEEMGRAFVLGAMRVNFSKPVDASPPSALATHPGRGRAARHLTADEPAHEHRPLGPGNVPRVGRPGDAG